MPYTFALVGQTASGKNRLAVEAVEALARLGGPSLEIISLDSMKVYRHMDLGTAKPDAALRARVPHHLLDVVEPSERFDAGRYVALAKEAEARIRARSALPLYVGGTGMYLHFLVYGHFEGPGSDPRVRKRLHALAEAEGSQALHRRLAELDPASASRLHANDLKRLVRALEVYELTGKPLSEVQREERPRSDVALYLYGVRWPRELLDARINRRTAQMFAAGWVDEVRTVRDEHGGFGPQAREALGYREILHWLDTPPEAREVPDEAHLEALVAQRTRRFARRQMTWFKRFPLAWLDLDETSATEQQRAAHAEQLAHAWHATLRHHRINGD